MGSFWFSPRSRAPDRGAWQAILVLPRPLAGGQRFDAQASSRLFSNPVVRSHTQQVSASVWYGNFHPRTWTLYGSLGSLNHSRRGRYSEVFECRETRGAST